MKNKKDNATPTDVNELVETELTETPDGERKRAKRGSSISAEIKKMFMELVGEYVTSGQVAGVTWDAAKDVFERVPTTKGLGIPAEIQIANIDGRLEEMFSSGNVDQDELRQLLNRKQRLQKQIENRATDAEIDADNDDSDNE